MKKKSIKAHLAPYSILRKRKTTINHAFASAIAPATPYEAAVLELEEAIRSLGQDPDGDLKCVYCGGEAATWDHLVGLVEKSQFSGKGHQIGNLVPCCGVCNSKKGSKSWEIHLKKTSPVDVFEQRHKLIADYAAKYAVSIDPQAAGKLRPGEWQRYEAIKAQILGLMEEADGIAKKLRDAVLADDQQRQV